MKNLRNSVTLIGRLGANPEVKELGKEKAVAKISLATDDSYKNAKGEKVQSTQWHTVVAWNRQAKFAEKYLTKGSQIAIEGKLVHRMYEDSKGEKKYITEVIANEFLMLS
jgi:single-strand DNA-binding protein